MNEPLAANTLIGLAVAALIGLVIGIEREWSGKAIGPSARFAGIRTFFILGVLGGIAGFLVQLDWEIAGGVLLAGGIGLVLAAYINTTRRRAADLDATTEVAALLVLGLAVLAVQGFPVLAGGITALVALALREKTLIHRTVQRIGEDELRAAVHFAVLALVVLPLLPEGPYGPLGGIRPRSLWSVVLLFSALSYVGYVARRIAGPDLGYPITGALGGLLSSTAVTLHFSRLSRKEPGMGLPLAVGTLAACVVLLPRVVIVSAILNPAVARALLPYMIAPAVVGLLVIGAVWFTRRARQGAAGQLAERNPLRLRTAILMAIGLQAVMMVITWVRETWGSPGILASAAVLGLTDVDALTLSMSTMGTTAQLAQLGAQAIIVGIVANTALKLTLSVVLGGGRYRLLAAGGLVLLGVAAAAGLWFPGGGLFGR